MGVMAKMSDKSMNKARAAPRCLAKTRRGTACLCPALRGRKRCRLHGGLSTGPPKGNRNAWKHGAYSAQARHAAALVRVALKAAKLELLEEERNRPREAGRRAIEEA